MIRLENMTKKYRHLTVFDHLNITFEPNIPIHIKGTNGCGKSVLLKLITGYSLPDEGFVSVDGIRIGIDRDFLPDAGVVINSPEFIRNLSGLDNLLDLASIRKICTKEKIVSLAKEFHFETELTKKYKTYSTGMKQKMRLIQALMEDPRYLILDEPFDGLDLASKKILKKKLENYLKKSGNTLIYTNHEDDIHLDGEHTYLIDCFILKELPLDTDNKERYGFEGETE
jgi:ABC-2 type transport system ATP-binding protein